MSNLWKPRFIFTTIGLVDTFCVLLGHKTLWEALLLHEWRSQRGRKRRKALYLQKADSRLSRSASSPESLERAGHHWGSVSHSTGADSKRWETGDEREVGSRSAKIRDVKGDGARVSSPAIPTGAHRGPISGTEGQREASKHSCKSSFLNKKVASSRSKIQILLTPMEILCW